MRARLIGPCPFTCIANSKLVGEKILNYCSRAYLIRTSRLFGLPAKSAQAKKSFVQLMIDLSNQQKELKVVDEEKSCPTYVTDLAQQTRYILETQQPFGIYHITNSGSCTWYEFAKELFNILKKDVILIPVSADHFPRLAKRPKYSVLLNTKLPNLPCWQESLEKFLKLTK